MTRTPGGVKLICVLAGFGMVFDLYNSVFLLAAGISGAAIGQLFLAGFLLLVSLVKLPVLVGLWRLRSWAGKAAVVLFGFTGLLNLVNGGILVAFIEFGFAFYLAVMSFKFS